MAITKAIHGYNLKSIDIDDGRKDFMLYDGGSGFIIMDPNGNTIGKSVTKGVAMDMVRAHHRGSSLETLKPIKLKPEDKEFIKFFEDQDVGKYKPQGFNREEMTERHHQFESSTPSHFMTKEYELKEKRRLSKILKKEFGGDKYLGKER